MKNEIEVRFLAIDKKKLVKKLRDLGAKDEGEQNLTEVIFYDSKLSWIKQSCFARLRTVNDRSVLTYKQNLGQKIDSAYEIELDISKKDRNSAIALLEKVGLVAYRHQQKKRHTFKIRGVTVDIDTWPKIPTYVEIEGSSEKKLRNVAAHIGFNWKDAVFEDARGIIENRYNIPIRKLKWFTFDKYK